MSGAPEDPATTAHNQYLTGTEALGREQEMDTALFEFKVFNISITVVAFSILTFTGLYCFTVCYNRSRQSKRAHMYESAVTREELDSPVAVRAVKRATSFINPFSLFKRPEADRDRSKIYYIYSNPLPIGVEEDETESGAPCGVDDQTTLSQLPTIQEYAEDPSSGVILDPPMFYMQL